MKAAIRLGICLVMAAASTAAFAQSNGCGDGEANVPFEGITALAPMTVGEAEEVGAGSGEPGRLEEPGAAAARAKRAAIDEHNYHAFLNEVWTAP